MITAWDRSGMNRTKRKKDKSIILLRKFISLSIEIPPATIKNYNIFY